MESKMTDNYFEDLLVGAEPWSIEQVREDYERVQETLGQARVWAKDLKTDLDQTRKDRDSAEATIARLQEEKALLSMIHEEARTNLIKKRDEARAERDLAEAACAELKDEVARLLADVNAAMDERDAARTRAERAEGEADSLRLEVVRLEAEAKTLQESNDRLLNHLSMCSDAHQRLVDEGHKQDRELLAEVASVRAVLAKVEAWTHTYGAGLTPAAGVADTHGEGVRACKAQVLAILAARLRERAGGGDE